MPHNRAPASPQLAGLASGRASVSMDDNGTRGAAAGGRAPRLTAGRLPAPAPCRYRFVPFGATQMG